jgi:predicted Zn-dependent peptidase
LKIFEDILAANMKGKLFQIREKTGLFYNIEASLTKESEDEPGYIYISTLVYPSNLKKLEKIIDNLITTLPESITQKDIDQSKNMVIHSFIDNFSSHEKIISTLLFLNNNHYNNDYYREKVEEIKKITLEDVKKIAKQVFNKKNIFKIKIGR